MKVLMLVRNDCAADPRVRKEALSLSKQHEVVIVATNDENGPAEETLSRTLKISRIQTHGFAGPLRHLYFKIVAIIRGFRLKPDVVHSHDLDTLFEGWVIHLLSGARLVYDSHELFNDTMIPQSVWEKLKRLYWRVLEAILIRQAYAVFTVNPFIARELQRRYALRKPPLVIYNVGDYSRLKNSKEVVRQFQKRFSKRKKIVYTGVITPSRIEAFEILFRALARIEKRPLAYLVGVFGIATLEKLVKKLRLEKDVIFIPKKPVPVTFEYVRVADAGFVALTGNCLNNYLGSPNKLFDYIYYEKPIIAFDLPFVSYVIKKFGVGTISSEDPAELADKIERILKKPPSHQAFARAQKAFSWGREEKKLLTYYKRLESQKTGE